MIRRIYHCDVCNFQFEHVCEKRDPDPDCPQCAFVAIRDEAAEAEKDRQRMQDILDSGRAPAVIGHKAKAIDIAQQMSESMGYTDMKDNTRPGEANFKPESPITTAEAETAAREIMQYAAARSPMEPVSPHIAAVSGHSDPVHTFWGGAGAVQGEPGPGSFAPANVSASAPAAAAARAEGNDPVAKLHEAGKQGLLGPTHVPTGYCPMPKETGL